RQVDFPRAGDSWGRGVGEDRWLRREDAVLFVADNAGGRLTFTRAGLWLGTHRGPGTRVSGVRGAPDPITPHQHQHRRPG
ncbi:hypothetical protein, partial [Curtobacterium sp. PsM8]|uniref:hypothetical protein n=1 Tax=Curtobacterium sp. PsM8 TaxID=3030532 RepID=UPI00263A8C7C